MYQLQKTPTVEESLQPSQLDSYPLKKAILALSIENRDLKNLNLNSENRILKLEQEVLALTIAAEYERNVLIKRFNSQKDEFAAILSCQQLPEYSSQQETFQNTLNEVKTALFSNNSQIMSENINSIILQIKSDFTIEKEILQKQNMDLKIAVQHQKSCSKCTKTKKKVVKMQQRIQFLEEQNQFLLKDLQCFIRKE
ncbi:hypothetical protein SS50377_20366 [Spironucleus salmonicida]|uniref:Uncharacterized protein n=1 Tax=Spironucleus salmonicida TaxID=348837 RepID=V6LET8_9EUKA|nr:hypothetical protein SS50377_20366 [Spironucleus salmonicida]|eukprot:EST43045.1 Hypothetical protein SS50377_17348 [Spironucleus salmonicida]